MITKMNDATAVLKGVNDEASAKAADSKLKSIFDDMKKLKEQGEALPKPTSDEEKTLQAKYEKDMETALSGMVGEMMRIGMKDEKAAKALEGSMSSLDKSLPK